MKPHRLEKKLSLNKKTVAQLNDISMRQLKGGADEPCEFSGSCTTELDPSCGCRTLDFATECECAASLYYNCGSEVERTGCDWLCQSYYQCGS